MGIRVENPLTTRSPAKLRVPLKVNRDPLERRIRETLDKALGLPRAAGRAGAEWRMT